MTVAYKNKRTLDIDGQSIDEYSFSVMKQVTSQETESYTEAAIQSKILSLTKRKEALNAEVKKIEDEIDKFDEMKEIIDNLS